jgi:hypothetical protein
MIKHLSYLVVVLVFPLALSGQAAAQEYLGDLSANPYAPNSTSNPYGAGSEYNPNSVTILMASMEVHTVLTRRPIHTPPTPLNCTISRVIIGAG